MSEQSSDAVAEAWGESFLADLPAEIEAELLAGARVVDLGSGDVFCRNFEDQFPFLIVNGLIRYYLQGPKGRQVTMVYRSSGEIANLMVGALGASVDLKLQQLWSEDNGMHYGCEAVRPTAILRLPGRVVRTAIRHDPSCAWVVVQHMMSVLGLAQIEVAADVLLPVQSRLARHLLSLAEREGDRLVVHTSNQNLADAVGSVRDVTSRVLNQMAQSGIIARERRCLVLLEPSLLHDLAVGRTTAVGETLPPLL